ncbi:MAG TPA: acyltransferase family protein [Tahibacter sp.]|nr:acyltransferase family protein [Tahibacter sp.]
MQRRYDIDALRVFAFAFLILYHCAMLWVHDWGWHVKSTYQTEWLQPPMLFINRWRMALLFLLSGVAVGLVAMRGGAARFAGLRSWRLLLPLVFGMFFIVPVQAYCQGVMNGHVQPGFGEFMLRYWQVRPWPKDAFDGWEWGITWNHLWYLAYLWVYTMILCALMPLFESPAGLKLRAWLTQWRGPWLIVVPTLPFLLALWLLAPHFPAENDLFNDWFQHAVFFTVFVYGWLMARETALWDEIRRLRKVTLVVALAAFTAYFTMMKLAPDDAPAWLLQIIRTARGFYLWTALLTILGWAMVYLDKPFQWLPRANEAVYPWYVLHQSVIVLIAYWLVPLKLGAVAEVVLVIGGTVVGCAVLVAVIRRVPVLRPLFGMKFRDASRRPEAPAEAVATS